VDNFFLYRHGPRLLLTVHDSIVGEYDHRREDVSQLCFDLEQLMVKGVNKKLEERFGMIPLPLEIDIDTGLSRWGE
jgi:hypothetical protein